MNSNVLFPLDFFVLFLFYSAQFQIYYDPILTDSRNGEKPKNNNCENLLRLKMTVRNNNNK